MAKGNKMDIKQKIRSFSDCIKIYFDPLAIKYGYERSKNDWLPRSGVYYYTNKIQESNFILEVQRSRYKPEFRVGLSGPRNDDNQWQLKYDLQIPRTISPDGLVEGCYWWPIESISQLPDIAATVIGIFEREYPIWINEKLRLLDDPTARRSNF